MSPQEKAPSVAGETHRGRVLLSITLRCGSQLPRGAVRTGGGGGRDVVAGAGRASPCVARCGSCGTVLGSSWFYMLDGCVSLQNLEQSFKSNTKNRHGFLTRTPRRSHLPPLASHPVSVYTHAWLGFVFLNRLKAGCGQDNTFTLEYSCLFSKNEGFLLRIRGAVVSIRKVTLMYCSVTCGLFGLHRLSQ